MEIEWKNLDETRLSIEIKQVIINTSHGVVRVDASTDTSKMVKALYEAILLIKQTMAK